MNNGQNAQTLGDTSAHSACSDCHKPLHHDGKAPPDGWQLEDGRTVCHACCLKDFQKVCYGITTATLTVKLTAKGMGNHTFTA